jgi:hypothetical protein
MGYTLSHIFEWRPTFPPVDNYKHHTTFTIPYIPLEMEPDGSSHGEVLFSLLRFPAVNIPPPVSFRSPKFPDSCDDDQQEQSHLDDDDCWEEQEGEENVDNNDGHNYMWDDGGGYGGNDEEYFDDCGLEFVAPEEDDTIDNIDLTSESAEEALPTSMDRSLIVSM